MKREFDDILNECIDRMMEGEIAESCLADYPEYAAELKPLLSMAQDTKKAAEIMPRLEFRQQAAYEFQTALRALEPKKHIGLRWQFRFVTVLSVIVVILMVGTGTVAAASNSLPDEILYPVKLATEDVRLALTFSEIGKAELYAEFADRRVEEIIEMAEEGKVAQVVSATVRMNDQLVAISSISLDGGDAVFEEGGQRMMLAVSETLDMTTAAPTAPEQIPVPLPGCAPVVTVPSESVPMATEEVSKANNGNGAAKGKSENTNREEKIELEITLSNQAIENTMDLQEVLTRVPDDVRKAIEDAINVLGNGYAEALENIAREK